jgi:hypothetical protein
MSLKSFKVAGRFISRFALICIRSFSKLSNFWRTDIVRLTQKKRNVRSGEEEIHIAGCHTAVGGREKERKDN